MKVIARVRDEATDALEGRVDTGPAVGHPRDERRGVTGAARVQDDQVPAAGLQGFSGGWVARAEPQTAAPRCHGNVDARGVAMEGALDGHGRVVDGLGIQRLAAESRERPDERDGQGGGGAHAPADGQLGVDREVVPVLGERTQHGLPHPRVRVGRRDLDGTRTCGEGHARASVDGQRDGRVPVHHGVLAEQQDLAVALAGGGAHLARSRSSTVRARSTLKSRDWTSSTVTSATSAGWRPRWRPRCGRACACGRTGCPRWRAP